MPVFATGPEALRKRMKNTVPQTPATTSARMPAIKSDRTLEPPEEERGCSLAIKLLPKITWDRAEAGDDAGVFIFAAGNAGFCVCKFEFCELQPATELDWADCERLYSESPFGVFSVPGLNA